MMTSTPRLISPDNDSAVAIGGAVTSGTAGSVLFVATGPILAQDNANFFWDDTNNRLGIGTATPEAPIDIATVGTTGLSYIATNYSTNGAGPYIRLRQSRGTEAAPTIVSSGDDCGYIQFLGYDGSTFRTAANITVSIDGAPGASDMPGRLVFSTTADGAATVTERMRIDSLGRIQQQVGGATAQALTGSTFVVAKSQAGITTVGSGRYFSLQNTSGSPNQVVEIGFGYMAAGVNQPVLIGHKVSDATAFTKGSLYMAVRDVTTDTAPTEVWTLGSTGQVTQNMPAVASTAETLHTWKISDDAIGKVQILNLSTTDAVFASAIQGSSASTTQGFAVRGLITTDTGTNAALSFVAATTGLSALATRPLFIWQNAGTTVMQTSATGNLTITNTVNNEGLTVNTVSATSALYLARTTTSAQSWGILGNNTNFRFRNETAGTDFMTILPDGAITSTITAAASTAETLHTWKVSDDASSYLNISNASSSDGAFVPRIETSSPGNNQSIMFLAKGTTDSGTSALMHFDARIGASTAVATRPLFKWLNNNTGVMILDNRGRFTLAPLAATSGTTAQFILTPGADTGITASTESNVFRIDAATRTWATTGTVATQRDVMFNGMTYASASASQTFTRAATLYATQPLAGTNAILTNSYAAWFQATAVASAAENIALFTVSDDAVAKLEIGNSSTADSVFSALITGTGSSTSTSLNIYGRATTDTGTNPVVIFDARTVGDAAIATRPMFSWRNVNVEAMQLDALGRLKMNTAAAYSTTGLTSQGVLYYGATGGVLTLAAFSSAGNTQFNLNTAIGSGTNATRFAISSVGAMILTPATTISATTVGGTTFTETAAASTAETIMTWKVSDDAVAKIDIINGTATDTAFNPIFRGTGASNRVALTIIGAATTDTGATGALQLDGRTTGGAAITTRPVIIFTNNNTTIAQFSGSTAGNYFGTSYGRVKAVRSVSSTTITVAVTDHIVLSSTGGGAVAVSLPASPETGREYTIKDNVGDAGTNNITVTPAAGNIDGAGTYVMNANYEAATFVYNGTQWNVVSSHN